VAPLPDSRCCRSTPRCRTCPLRFYNELREVRAIGQPPKGTPAHLADVPACLHKYEPLLRSKTTA
jgi:hypothetical protein